MFATWVCVVSSPSCETPLPARGSMPRIYGRSPPDPVNSDWNDGRSRERPRHRADRHSVILNPQENCPTQAFRHPSWPRPPWRLPNSCPASRRSDTFSTGRARVRPATRPKQGYASALEECCASRFFVRICITDREIELVVIPCHRVVCSDGSIGQYVNGPERKAEPHEDF